MCADDGERRREIERLLVAIRGGDEGAKGPLYELVFQELRRMAGNLLIRERDAYTLQATALVNEAYLKVFVGAPLRAADRAFFFATQARAMRQLLVEHARRRRAAKRPDDRAREPLDYVVETFISSQHVALLDLDAALEELKAAAERVHEVVVLRYFGGLSWKEIAGQLDVSVSTVEKDWQAGRAWLYARLRSEA